MSSPAARVPAGASFPATRAASPGAHPSSASASAASAQTHLLLPPQQQTNSRCGGNDAHARQLAREQQQMIEQLTSTGLVQAADLLEFGFSAAELRAAGLHLSSPHHRANEQTESRGEATKAERLADGSNDDRRRRGVPRKRAWGCDPAQAPLPQDERATSSPAVSGTATTALSTVEKAREPQTIAKAVVTPLLLSEKTRKQCLHAAKLVEDTQIMRPFKDSQDCARWLCYDDADEEEASSTSATGSSSGDATVAVTSKVHSMRDPPKARCNTALAFSGLDVAVVREIAQRLQEESSHDAYVESRRTREYFLLREDGNTPYM
ncbi:hypothetical protein GH5_06519 [Leishmania sp. Ghana 2012 LV757]|uniref:hypothetical protein n=1 Tax=Leishmania sp. Ghana 2012 LV757 TaxID=2803181 RepID=UPI001B660C7A|nr:hypothetical protein GH5_06519 [Leishmania sp. Ghana 2012 LV757]